MSITFEQWESGYVFHRKGEQIAAGLYGDDGFELLEDTGLSVHSNAMCAFSYLKVKYEPNSQPLKQATVDLFTPRKGSNANRGEEQRAIAKSSISRLKSTHPVLYPQDPDLRDGGWRQARPGA